MWRKWFYRFQSVAGVTEKECRAFLLLSLLVLIGAGARFVNKGAGQFDPDYYAPIYEEFRRLAEKPDSLLQESEDAIAPAGEITTPNVVTSADSEKLNLNAADADALQHLPRIGPALAGRILELRAQLGSFLSPDDLIMVPGIGEKTLEMIRDLVYVDRDSLRE